MQIRKLGIRELIEKISKWSIAIVAIFGMIIGIVETVADLDTITQSITSHYPALEFIGFAKNTSSLLLLIFSLFVLSAVIEGLITIEDIKSAITHIS